MKTTLIFISMLHFFSSSLHAVTFDVIGPCSQTPLYQGSFKTNLEDSVGKISMDIFDFYQIPYIGTEDGMNSIAHSPVGLEAIEVLSDTKMRAYGWCYTINNVLPDVLASAMKFSRPSDHITWFYAFSTYNEGEWTDYCVPAYTVKAPQFCQK